MKKAVTHQNIQSLPRAVAFPKLRKSNCNDLMDSMSPFPVTQGRDTALNHNHSNTVFSDLLEDWKLHE